MYFTSDCTTHLKQIYQWNICHSWTFTSYLSLWADNQNIHAPFKINIPKQIHICCCHRNLHNPHNYWSHGYEVTNKSMFKGQLSHTVFLGDKPVVGIGLQVLQAWPGMVWTGMSPESQCILNSHHWSYNHSMSNFIPLYFAIIFRFIENNCIFVTLH